eukprot:g15981.t1
MDTGTINRFLLGSLLISGAASGGFMLELGPSTISLLRISLYKPFYVGDLVTLNKSGDMGMKDSLVGFVENITMMYVVIRNFEMKQVWISHKAFNELVIQNWTRRPTKTVLLNIGISTRAPEMKVKRLQDGLCSSERGGRWAKTGETMWAKTAVCVAKRCAALRKCHITSTSNGYNLEVIFFPMVGVSHRQIRQKFLMSFMEAAERLNVPFVPLQLMQNFCEDMDPSWPKQRKWLERWLSMTCRSSLLAVAVLALLGLAAISFVSEPAPRAAPESRVTGLTRAETALLGAAIAAAPEVAHAGNSGYALLQLGWAIFIISLGPAVLFWIYFNKPELL